MSFLSLAATPETGPTQATPEREPVAHLSCTRTLLRLRASSLLAARATEPSDDSHRPAPIILSLEVDNQTPTDAPPAVTPACIRTIVALASLARRRRTAQVSPTTSECCATSQTARLQFNVEKVCAHHAASTPEQRTPSHETAVHGPTVIRHAHRRSRPRFRSAYRLPRLPNAPIDVENPFFVQLEVTHFPITYRTHWSPDTTFGTRVPSGFRFPVHH